MKKDGKIQYKEKKIKTELSLVSSKANAKRLRI